MLQQTQPELTPARSEQPQTTPYRTVTHDHGRYPVITGDKYFHNGYPYPINTTAESGVRLDILMPIAAELDAMLKAYSRVCFVRFDLHLPEGTTVDTGNGWVSQLFKTLRERLKSKNRRPEGISAPINIFAYGWVREQKDAEQPHYHCWLALPHKHIQRIGGRTYGIGSTIVDIWCKLTGEEHTLTQLLNKNKKYSTSYVIHRGQPETLEGPIYWVSYLAKESGKYQTGKGDKIHSTSQLRNKKP